MTRTNLVDAYDNRSVVAKLVSMEERISGAETSVEASAEAAASSASAAAASQTAAKTSETSAKASADTAAATLSNTVDLTSKQTVTGAKTFAGDTTVTGSFVTSGNAEMSKLDIDTGKLTVGSGGSAEINGPLTASNTSNVLKVADHDSVLTGNDVLNAKDIMTANGDANNLVHRSGNELVAGIKEGIWAGYKILNGPQLNGKSKWIKLCTLTQGETQPDFITISNAIGTYHTNASFFAFAQLAGANGNRTYSIINTQQWINNYRIVSLNNSGSWELWAMISADRNYSWIEIRSLRGGTNVVVPEDFPEYDSLPTGATNVIYLLGSA